MTCDLFLYSQDSPAAVERRFKYGGVTLKKAMMDKALDEEEAAEAKVRVKIGFTRTVCISLCIDVH